MKCEKCEAEFEGIICPNCNSSFSAENDPTPETVSSDNAMETSLETVVNTEDPNKGQLPQKKFTNRILFKIIRIVIECICIITIVVYAVSYEDTVKKANELVDEYNALAKDYNDLSNDYDTYKAKMKPYEELEKSEAEARKIEAEKVLEEQKAAEEQKRAEEEAKQKAITSATTEQKNALNTAANYLQYSSFSHSGLVKQLEYEGYSNESATYAADNCGADWNEQAAKKAQDYLDYSSFSRQGLIDQLEYEGFTAEQAEYGVQAVGY